MSKIIQKIRSKAFKRQSGRCIYCDCLMWQASPELFAKEHSLSMRKVWALRCTAEHKVSRCNGGKNTQSNISAACAFCNHHRHRASRPLAPDLFREHVQRRIAKGAWHGLAP